MRISKNLNFINFKNKTHNKSLGKIYKDITSQKNEILNSLKPTYKYSYNQTLIKRYKNKNLRIIGMGGSVLGTKAIYNFLEKKFVKNLFH